MIRRLHINKFWDDEFKTLDYITEPFNDPDSVNSWIVQGYSEYIKFTGAMCDMRSPQPSWNQRFIDYFTAQGWKDIGTSYYRMDTCTILPVHADLYSRYVDLFNLRGKEESIYRAIVFLEDWSSGHYIEVDGTAITDWVAGDAIMWRYDVPHMAANIGVLPRYTLQITGHI